MEVLPVVSSIFGFYLAGQWQQVAVAVIPIFLTFFFLYCIIFSS